MMNKTAIVICSRTNSERVPNKPFKKVGGEYLLQHLVNRLAKTGIQIVVAVPREQINAYKELNTDHIQKLCVHPSRLENDVLGRMAEVSETYGIDTIIRVSHDKVFVDEKDIFAALDVFNKKSLDYLYSSKFTDGCGFEIISSHALKLAHKKFPDVEHISYAIRETTKNSLNFVPTTKHDLSCRFLIDYPQDIKLFEVLFSALGKDCTARDAIEYLKKNPEIKKINQLPKVTVYTCAYNAESYVSRAMMSVAGQLVHGGMEYIVVDDSSTDQTCAVVASSAMKLKSCRWIRNGENVGLASSSNIALKEARGKYIVRLDADDYFLNRNCVQDLVNEIESSGRDIVYPNNYFGKHGIVQKGKDSHHVGGAIFNRSALNYIKFTDGLRGYEGLDLFLRAKDRLSIGYLNKPIFLYTQRSDSMSKTDLDTRTKIRRTLLDNSLAKNNYAKV